MMVGHKVDLKIKREEPKNPQDRLFINNISVTNSDGTVALDDVSFVLRSGEILGVAGISGSGQKELLDAIAGLRRYKNGGEIIAQFFDYTDVMNGVPSPMVTITPAQYDKLKALCPRK